MVDAASGDHSFDLYMSLLKSTGVLALVGLPSEIKLSPLSHLLGTWEISNAQTCIKFVLSDSKKFLW